MQTLMFGAANLLNERPIGKIPSTSQDICYRTNESNVIAEGSSDKVLSGKHYNRSVRFHKLMFEACVRLIWESFLEWNTDSGSSEVINQATENISSLSNQNEVDEEMFESVLEDDNVVQMYKSFQEYVKKLRSDNDSLSHFWMSYINLVSLLLNLIRASREGNWSLHLSSIREMIPWCFSYNRTNYARYLPISYYREMKCLPQTHPGIHNYLQNDGFSCQIGSQNTFGMIPMDQTIEETINKDTQTAGGTKCLSKKQNAVPKYYITVDDRASFVREMRCRKQRLLAL